MSKSLLSKRLRELEHAGLVEHRLKADAEHHGYYLTPAGAALRPIIEALGVWGHLYVRSSFDDRDLDPSLLLWDMRRWIPPAAFPDGRVVIEFEFPEQPANQRRWWLLKEAGSDELDLCLHFPGFDVDLLVSTDLKTLSRIWVGDLEARQALQSEALQLEGSGTFKQNVPGWISLSPFASV